MALDMLTIDYGKEDAPFLPPLVRLEHGYNLFAKIFLYVSLVIIGLLPFPVVADILARQFLGFTFTGVTEIETMALVLIAFGAMPYVTATRSHIVIDLFFDYFPQKTQRGLYLFCYALSTVIAGLLAWRLGAAALESSSFTAALYMPESMFLAYCSVSLGAVSLGMAFQALHAIRSLQENRDHLAMIIALGLAAAIFLLPAAYRVFALDWSKLAIGGVGFLILFTLLFLRVPIGLGMCCMGILGLLTIMRTPASVWSLVAEVPYREVANFVLVAIPMFMLMGELTSVSSISRDMFNCANKWLGRMPGGLACAAVGGCAGFGAICGDSMTTVITMSAVALPQMRQNNYAPSLAAGALAAGGTLGILIPPSMGFIFYSIMTEESVGKLFVAGILPGIVLTMIFMGIIVFQVKRNPVLAPASAKYSLHEKLASLAGLIPMILLFVIVVGGIMTGYFTPGEGGAVGALCAFLYALARRQLTMKGVRGALFSTALMTGKIFVILVGVYVFGVFLAQSRMPALLATFVAGLDMSMYAILAIVIVIYIILGCVMNIIPMMLLTLPSIYPTIQALNIDGIWFGVITVIVMEMGMITPPIGLNVFTMASLAPDISMGTVFRGVMPFFLGMLLCVLLVILFPQLALWLPNL